MKLQIKLPLWLAYRAAKRYPWLLGNGTTVNRTTSLAIFEIQSSMRLSDEQKRALLKRYPDLSRWA